MRVRVRPGAGTAVSTAAPLGAVVAGFGIGQVLQGRGWGYPLIAVGLGVSVPCYVRLLAPVFRKLRRHRAGQRTGETG